MDVLRCMVDLGAGSSATSSQELKRTIVLRARCVIFVLRLADIFCVACVLRTDEDDCSGSSQAFEERHDTVTILGQLKVQVKSTMVPRLPHEAVLSVLTQVGLEDAGGHQKPDRFTKPSDKTPHQWRFLR